MLGRKTAVLGPMELIAQRRVLRGSREGIVLPASQRALEVACHGAVAGGSLLGLSELGRRSYWVGMLFLQRGLSDELSWGAARGGISSYVLISKYRRQFAYTKWLVGV